MASIEDSIFFNIKDAIEHFLRMGFELTEDKRLIRNNLEVVIKPIGSEIYRSSVYKRFTDGY